MPNTREKLIEILHGAIKTHTEKKEQWILGGKVGEEPMLFGSFADHLIANGVTVQEWISVKDRLPESDGECVLIALRCGVVDIGWYYKQFGCWKIEFVNRYEDGENTHWMPLPQPPKGE